ncbi:MAG: phosphonate ABC transporter ATP-binding protein [Pseudomonadota bacterium]|nr:phosphonate ABC transporter ATP-binding protein [Pseudomonadota bacterium]
MLSTNELTKTFGAVTAVNRVSLEFRPGEMVGIIGRSGAGKSTFLRVMNRLTDPTDGQVIYNDQDVTALRGREKRGWQAQCAMIFQQFNLVPRVDVVTNVLFGTLYRQSALVSMLSLFSRDDIAKAVEILDRLDIVEHAAKRAEALSGGQQQRVAIARALMQDPEVILADEPIASLDPLNAQIVMQTLRRIHEEDGRMIICNLHTLDTARTYCDRVIGMRNGEVVFDGKSTELTAKVAREIYGAGEEFSEETTSTSIDSLASGGAEPALVSV